MTSKKWGRADIPPLDGKTFAVTGANSGLGLETVRALAGRGAHVLLACRNRGAAEKAVHAVRRRTPRGRLDVMALDLADLDSVRAFAEAARVTHPAIDGLINNAGVMALPYRQTKDGFEMHFGTNHLGHFALTGRLLPALMRAPHARVVTVSSQFHRLGRMDFADPNWERRAYDKWRAYAQSKLANLLFAFELDRRLREAGADVLSVAAHPGYAATNLQRQGARTVGSAPGGWFGGIGNTLFAQSAENGALPILRAASEPGVPGGSYYGPAGPMELRGAPVTVTAHAGAHSAEDARRLWALSEELTGVAYEFG